MTRREFLRLGGVSSFNNGALICLEPDSSVCQLMNLESRGRGRALFPFATGHMDIKMALRRKQLRHEERHFVAVTSFLPKKKSPLPDRRKLAEQEDVLHHFLFLTLSNLTRRRDLREETARLKQNLKKREGG